MRKFEIIANAAFDTYQGLYYEDGISSVYVWDMTVGKPNQKINDLEKVNDKPNEKITDDPKEDHLPNAFAVAILIHKRTEDGDNLRQGRWDSIHLVEVESSFNDSDKAKYRLTSTVILDLDSNLPGIDQFGLSGSLTRTAEQEQETVKDHSAHLVHIGRMVEQMESQMRSGLQEIYFGKTHEIVNEMRLVGEEQEQEAEEEDEVADSPNQQPAYMRHQTALQREMAQRLGGGGGFKQQRPSNATAALTMILPENETMSSVKRSVSLQ